MGEIEDKAAALGAKIAARRAAAVKAMTDRDPEFPEVMELLRETFGATIAAVRAPETQYGRNPFEGLIRSKAFPMGPKITWKGRGQHRKAVVAYTQSE